MPHQCARIAAALRQVADGPSYRDHGRMVVDERPLLGRDAELRDLATVLADVAAHRGRVVVVTGEAGIGKTGLVG
jgi:DNA-binding NtrC family response regulator